MSRLKLRKKVEGGDKLKLTKHEIRFATPIEVARYRAKKLKCKTIADIGCGQGFQAFAFAKECEKVIAVDIDKEKITAAKNNAKKLKINNIEFIAGDALSKDVLNRIKDCNIIFLDTERPASSKSRNINELKPDIKKFLERYSKITDKVCIEIPPYLNVTLDCEKEYISLYGELNRLNLYLGKLKEHDKSVVVLPEEVKIFSKGLKPKESKEVLDYVYEINPAVIISGLIAEAMEKGMMLYKCGTKFYAVSKKHFSSPFFKAYKVIDECEENDVLAALKDADAGSVILHESIVPEAYWEKRKAFEKNLDGDKKIHVFVLNKKCFLCERKEKKN